MNNLLLCCRYDNDVLGITRLQQLQQLHKTKDIIGLKLLQQLLTLGQLQRLALRYHWYGTAIKVASAWKHLKGKLFTPIYCSCCSLQ